MKAIFGIGLLHLLLFSISLAEAFEKAPRITDREIIERLTRLEEGQKALSRRIGDVDRRIDQRFGSVDQRFEGVEQRFDDLSTRLTELRQLMLWGFGLSFAGMFALISLVIWDRRTTLAPALKRIEALEKLVAENALAAR